MFADANIDKDIVALIAAIIAAAGGWKGISTLVKKAGRLVEIGEQLEQKSKKLDDVYKAAEDHSARLADLERGQMAIPELEARTSRHESQLAAYLEASEHGAWISDSSGRCIQCNTALTKMMMCSKDVILGNSWRDLIHPDDRDRVVQKWMDFVRGDRSVFQDDYRYQASDGRVVSVRGTAIRPSAMGTPSEYIYGWAKLSPIKGVLT